jgi:DNA polymerase-3 subunit beta
MELEPSNQVLKLSCGVHRANLHGIDAVEFPPLPQPPAEPAIEVDSIAFQNAITQTTMAASADEASPVLTGVLLQVSDGRLTLAATDRHRLAVKTLDATVNGSAPGDSVIVPSRHLNEVARAAGPNRPRVAISFSEARNQVFFSVGDVEISSRLIEGTYPNYAQVIPGESSTTVNLPTASLLRDVKTAAVLARDAANPVRLRVGEGTLTLHAQTAEVGEDEAPLSASVHGDEVQIAFNARYMMDALAVLDSDEVQLSFNGALHPGVIRPANRDDYLCIIMPVRVA